MNNVNIDDVDFDDVDINKLSQQGLINYLSETVKENSLDRTINIISRIQDLDRPDRYGYTILNAACMSGRIDVVRYLVENCRIDINKKGIEDSTSIICAAINEHYEIVKYLVEHGADPNIRDPVNKTAYDFLNENQERRIRSIANQHGFA